ncbi:MAG TPA: hypothetical protein ENF46_00095 [Candidatus Acetothermia bacterium]|nr:hypothetical protein [Candidatus Acetothermia bacterium]
MKRLLYGLLLVSFLGGLTLAQGFTVVDQVGREVSLPVIPQRVICTYGVITWYLYALGVQDRLVLGSYIGLKPDTPFWALLETIDPKLPHKAYRGKPTVEEILARDPDLVLGSKVKDLELAAALEEVGIPTLLFFAETPEGIKGALSLLGKVFGVEGRAARLISYFDEKTREIAASIPSGIEKPKVLFVGTDPLRVASGEMYQSAMIELAGGRSVTRGIPGYWQSVNIEQVLLWNPDVVFIAPYGRVTPEDILGDPLWADIGAVRSGRVYKLPRVLAPWDIPTPESFLGIVWMALKLHPDLSLDLGVEAKRFYREFYGLELPQEVLADILR